ncbi:hypothetical protein BDR03DRAFT_1001310 [Suillus americanus]|nr:hypothetical protein BDR03DRAFT_1001310 [Suillus americanus]
MTHQHLNLQLPGPPVPQASSSGTAASVGPQPPSDSAEPPEELGQGTARAKAAATRQSARLASIGADADNNSVPQSNAARVTPLPGAPAATAAATAAAKPPSQQPTSKQPAPASTPSAPSPPNPPAAAPMQQTVDVAALLSRITQLKQEQAVRTAQPIELLPKAPAPTLFALPEEVERARAAIIEAKKDKPKVSLPDVVPGFKANPLDTDLRGFVLHAPRRQWSASWVPTLQPKHADAAAHPNALDSNTELKASASLTEQ